MKKIIINLHPGGSLQEFKLVQAARQYIPFLFLGIIVLVVVNIFLFGLLNIFGLSHKTLGKNWQDLKPQVDEVKSLKDELQSCLTEKKQYQGILSGGSRTSALLAELFAALPKNIWIKHMTLDGQRLILDGNVVKWKEDCLVSVDKFIKALNKEEYFAGIYRNISLKNYRKININKVAAIEFRIECLK